MNATTTDQKKFFTEEDVTNLESFLIKHREKILDLLDKNSPNYIMRKSFVSERMRLKDTFEEYLTGGSISEKPPSADRFQIFQQSKRDIVVSKEFRSLPSEKQETKLREIISVIDDPNEEEINKIFQFDNPFWGSIDEEGLLLVTSFGRISFDITETLVVTVNLKFKEEGKITKEDIDFVKNNRNKIYSVKYVIGDTIKTFVTRQSLVYNSITVSSEDVWGPFSFIEFVFDKEFYDLTSSELRGTRYCWLSGIYPLSEDQIKLYEYVQNAIANYGISNKTFNLEPIQKHIEETIKEINSDMTSWNNDNLATLKLSI